MIGKAVSCAIAAALLASLSDAHAQERAVYGWRFGEATIERWKTARSEKNGLGEVIAPYCAEMGGDSVFAAEGYHKPDAGVDSCFDYAPSCRCASRLGHAATDRNMWTFLDGRLAYFDAVMPHRQRGNVGPWIRANYGFADPAAPASVRTRYGSRFQRIVRAWDLGDLMIVVHEHPNNESRSIVSIFDPDLLDELITRLGVSP